MTAHNHGRAQRVARGTTVVERRGGSTVCTELPAAEWAAFEAAAKARNLSKSALLRELVQQHLAQQ